MYQDIGLVFAQLVQYNRLELAGDIQEVLKRVLEANSLVLPGGIQAICEGNKSIDPSCCCGLETWREWIDFLETGQSPWLGHDPSPWLDVQGDLIRIWSDGGLESVSDAFYIDVSKSHFKQALGLLERDLQAFLFGIDSWAQDVGFERSSDLSRKFNECFKIEGRY